MGAEPDDERLAVHVGFARFMKDLLMAIKSKGRLEDHSFRAPFLSHLDLPL